MKELTKEEQFNWYLSTLNRLSTMLEIENDEELEYTIYEDLDIDVHTSFHENLHNKFVKFSMETEEQKENVSNLRQEFIAQVKRRLDAKDVRKDPDWIKVIEKARAICSVSNI